jgi:hypothetical protein
MVLMLVCSIVCSASELGETVVVFIDDQDPFTLDSAGLVFPQWNWERIAVSVSNRLAYATSRRPANVMQGTADAIHK